MTSICTETEKRLKGLLAGEVSDGEFKSLLGHSASCRTCRTLILLHIHLSAPEMAGPAADEDDLVWMRQGVLAGVRRVAAGPVPRPVRKHWSAPSVYHRVAAGLAAAAIGLSIGWILFAPSGDALLDQLSVEAAGNQRLTDSTESPFVISNVALREVNGRSVTVDFDVTRHVEVTRLRTDPLVQEVLVQALLDPASPGESLRAIRFSESLLDSRIKEGLLFAARYDANSGVRLKALQTAMALTDDADVKNTCIEILGSDASVQMRMLAVDYLADTREGPQLLQDFVDRDRSESGAAVRLRATQYLQ